MRSSTFLLALTLLVSAAPAPAFGQGRGSDPHAWHAALGMAGGYTRTHLVGLGLDLTSLSAPGMGSALGIATPATLYWIIPLGRRLALEPGLDAHRSQQTGTTTFTGHLSARIDFAVTGGWYAAAGGDFHYIEQTRRAGIVVSGASVAWGYRFHLTGDLGGRFETNYSMYKERSGFSAATNTLGFMFGITLLLK